MNKPEYNFGDFVKIAGYGSRVFKIESYRVEHCYSTSEEWTDIVYDLIDTETGAYVECDEEDMRLADVDDTEELDGTGIDIFDFTFGLGALYYEMEETNMAAKEPRKPTARELSGQEAAKRKQARKDQAAKVDDLLDLYNGYMAMFDETGEAVYKENADDAMVKLAELASAEN